jgi:hypothetical protein
MFFIISLFIGLCLLFSSWAIIWLLRDAMFTRLVKKEFSKYGYNVLEVKETRKRFDLPSKGHYPVITFGTTTRRTITQFREVVFSDGQTTASCLAAMETVTFKKPRLFFNINLPEVFNVKH